MPAETVRQRFRQRLHAVGVQEESLQVEPDLPVCGGVAEDHSAMNASRRDLEKVGDEFRVLSQINAAKARHPSPNYSSAVPLLY